MTMIERVARAMWDARHNKVPPAFERPRFDFVPREIQDEWRAMARAGIEAMGEPTDEMMRAFIGAMGTYDDQLTETGWRAAIDAALVSDPPPEQTPEASPL